MKILNNQLVTNIDYIDENQETPLLDDILKNSISIENTFSEQRQLPTVMLGKIITVDEKSTTILLFDDINSSLQAMSVCRVSSQDIGRTCVVQFIGGDIGQPIIMGLLNDPSGVETKQVLADSQKPSSNPPISLNIIQDEQRILIESEKEIVLQCGESQIVMTAEGVIHIRALYIDSQAHATHRLKGGSIQVN